MEFLDLMKDFGNDFGLADFRPSEDGTWKIAIDGMQIAFAELTDPARMRMFATVCALPEKGRKVLVRVMLESMFMGRATGGAFFSIDAGTDDVVLQRVDPLQTLDLDALKTSLERFVNVLEQWRGITSEFLNVAESIEQKEKDSEAEAHQLNLDGFMKV